MSRHIALAVKAEVFAKLPTGLVADWHEAHKAVSDLSHILSKHGRYFDEKRGCVSNAQRMDEKHCNATIKAAEAMRHGRIQEAAEIRKAADEQLAADKREYEMAEQAVAIVNLQRSDCTGRIAEQINELMHAAAIRVRKDAMDAITLLADECGLDLASVDRGAEVFPAAIIGESIIVHQARSYNQGPFLHHWIPILEAIAVADRDFAAADAEGLKALSEEVSAYWKAQAKPAKPHDARILRLTELFKLSRGK